jgi:cardiolipin synthase
MSDFFNPSLATVQMKPTMTSKVNTALQLVLVGATLGTPALFGSTDAAALAAATPEWLVALQWLVAGTTVASTVSYMVVKDTVRILKHRAAHSTARIRQRAAEVRARRAFKQQQHQYRKEDE